RTQVRLLPSDRIDEKAPLPVGRELRRAGHLPYRLGELRELGRRLRVAPLRIGRGHLLDPHQLLLRRLARSLRKLLRNLLAQRHEMLGPVRLQRLLLPSDRALHVLPVLLLGAKTGLSDRGRDVRRGLAWRALAVREEREAEVRHGVLLRRLNVIRREKSREAGRRRASEELVLDGGADAAEESRLRGLRIVWVHNLPPDQ